MSIPSDRAANLRTAYRVCDLKPLEGENLDRYSTHTKRFRQRITKLKIRNLKYLRLKNRQYLTEEENVIVL